MDPALASVIVAAITAVPTILAAVLTFLGSRRQREVEDENRRLREQLTHVQDEDGVT